MAKKKKRGRPPEKVIEPIPDTFENVLKAVVQSLPKLEVLAHPPEERERIARREARIMESRKNCERKELWTLQRNK